MSMYTRIKMIVLWKRTRTDTQQWLQQRFVYFRQCVTTDNELVRPYSVCETFYQEVTTTHLAYIKLRF
jgi:hypothetical protein